MKPRSLFLIFLVMFASRSVLAQGFFLPASDIRLRDDLSLLTDEGVLNLPLNDWPLAREDVAQAVAKIDPHDLQNAALRSALSRVTAATTLTAEAADWRLREVRATAGQPGLLRSQSTLGRENFELTTTGGATTDRYNITLAATGVQDGSKHQSVRMDGSDISVRWGNWLLSANQMDRWWGPGQDGSLILSTNARPMPSLSIDRLRSLPVDLPVIRRLGPWRFSTFLGIMENRRADVDHPLFMGMRLSFKPAHIFEFGLSRTAQFCGKGRRCGFGTFGRMLIGQDNIGRRGLNDPADEPGNQMAGFDVRLVSPFNILPLSLYAQMIGEDNSSTGIPERYLALLGADSWFLFDSGSVLRARLEYANTSVKWYNAGVEPDWAYRQSVFFAGYRYRSRNIGHSTDADSETASLRLSWTRHTGERWSMQYRHGRLDAYGSPDMYNDITFGRSSYKALEVSWEGELFGQLIGSQVGYERQRPSTAGNASGFFGFIQWRKPL